MRRTIATLLIGLVVVGAVIALVATGGSSGRTYRIELDNAFGIVTGADFKVAGVKAGTIQSINLNQKNLHAVVTVSVTTPGLGAFHADAFCISRPQSLIGEYFISCDPGTKGPVLPSGATIPVSQTESTIPADLLQDILRLPYRQRFSLIIGELGAAAAGRGGDLQAALQRAVPALTETDNLLNVLGNDSVTLQQLTAGSDSVITALANSSAQIKHFIVAANHAASDTATQEVNLESTLQKLPGFLSQLQPALARLGQATQANTPVLANLNSSSAQVDRLFTDLPGFSRAARPAIKYLGRASVTGTSAVKAATPTVAALNNLAGPTPDLAQNLAIVTHVLDDRSYAVEKNSRSPGGQGYTGLEALLQFAFNLAVATNTYGPLGHQLAVDAFVSGMCTPYASLGTIESNLKLFGKAARSCYAWLGPNQPGVNETDPSDPSACVPDPGGAPPGETGPVTSAAACGATPARVAATKHPAGQTSSAPARPTTHTPTTTPPSTSAPSGGSGASSSSGSSGAGSSGSNPLSGLGGILSGLLGGHGSGSGSGSGTGSTGGTGTGGLGGILSGLGTLLGGKSAPQSGSQSTSTSSAKQLLRYLIAP